MNDATPLMNLVDSNGIQVPAALRVACALLRHGARTDINDSNGETVLQLARKNHLPALVKMLEDIDRQWKQRE
jgi:ankyrin repeat protein